MDIHGQVDARFGPVRECFAEVARGQAGTGAAFAAFCDGTLVARIPRPGDGAARPVTSGGAGGGHGADALENALRGCLGLPPLPDGA